MKRALALLLRGVALASVLAVAAEAADHGASQLDPTLAISQYAHTAWRVEDGAFDAAPNAVTQTPDGYLWVGTDAGVVRFDGVRFVRWTSPAEAPALSSPVYSLLGTRDGSLWIGTGRGIVRWDRTALQQFPALIGRFNSMLESRDGAVWAVRSRLGVTMPVPGPLCRLTSNSARCFGASDGIACLNGGALFGDRHGDLWFGGSNALCRWNTTASRTYLQKELDATGGLTGITSLAGASDGSIWVGIGRSGGGLGLVRVRDETIANDVMPGFDASRIEVTALLVDRDDSVWLGAQGNGIYRIRGRTVDHFGSADGLSSDTVHGFYQDREGSVWVVTSRGLDRFRGFHVVSYSVRQGLTTDNVHSVLAASDGTIWIGTQGRLDRLRNGIASSLSARDGLPGKNTTALFEDRAHRLWVGVDDGLAVYENNTFRSVPSDDQEALGIVGAMTQDADGSIWVSLQGRRAGLLHVVDGKVRERIPETTVPRAFDVAADPEGGVWMALDTGMLGHLRHGNLERFSLGGTNAIRLQSLNVAADGSVWVATSEGLFHWKDGVARRLNRTNGLPCDSVFALVPEGSSGLWLYARCGVMWLSASEVGKWLGQPNAVVTPRVFDALDGALPAAATFTPHASRSPDGRVWFANDSVVQMIDRDRTRDLATSVEVHVEQLVADRRAYAALDGVHLLPRTRDLQIDYTATSLAVPEKIRFRYRLDGKDSDWQDVGNRRQAFYNDLSPGSYRFRVIASNTSGVWNETGATLGFSIAPAFYQTVWFRTLAVITLLSLLWSAYRIRLRVVERHQAEITALNESLMKAQEQERTRIAGELHDGVMQQISALSIMLGRARRKIQSDLEANAEIGDVQKKLIQVGTEVRQLSHDLHPASLEDGGLPEALRAYCDEFSHLRGVSVSCDAHDAVRELSRGAALALYRIAQEAMGNAAMHGAAQHIEVRLTRSNGPVALTVSDDGKGFDPNRSGASGGLGLINIRERARQLNGTFELNTEPGQGTTVRVAIPFRPAV